MEILDNQSENAAAVVHLRKAAAGYGYLDEVEVVGSVVIDSLSIRLLRCRKSWW